jgi:dUTP pyrophosphatase
VTHPPDLDMKDHPSYPVFAGTVVSAAPLRSDLPIGVEPPKHAGDVGWDLVAMNDVIIRPMAAADVPVNLRMALPEGVYVDIRNRSSMARRNLYVDQNLVDTGYRGPMFVFIRNMNLPLMFVPPAAYKVEPAEIDPGAVTIRAGERIAQMVFHRSMDVTIQMGPVPIDTPRGERGFGSTGT